MGLEMSRLTVDQETGMFSVQPSGLFLNRKNPYKSVYGRDSLIFA
jgi:hypothetical protein